MGLKTRIITFVVLALSVITLFLCFYITHQVKIFELKRLRAQIDKSVYLMRIINTLPLYNVDMEALKMNLETFFDDENMKSLAIHDSEINININYERPFPFGGTDIKRSFVIDHNGLKLGRLTVVYSTGLIEKKLADFRARLLWFIFSVILVMAVVLIFLINIITKPVAKLVRSTSEIAAGNFDREIEQMGVGEIGTLSRNFLLMRDAVKKNIEDLARTNTKLDGEIQQKKIQERKISYQRMVISFVNTFFQRSITAQSTQEIAEIFITIAQGVIPSPYCFVGQIGDSENNLKIIALSDQAQKQFFGLNNTYKKTGVKQQTPGRLIKAITDKAPVIYDNVSLNPEFSFLPRELLPIDSIMALPMLHGKDVLGLVTFAGKEGGYTREDQEAATMMIMALVEALSLRIQKDEKQRLEERMVQSEKMVSVGELAAGMAHKINESLTGIRKTVQMIRNSIENPVQENIAPKDKNSLDFNVFGQYLCDQGVFKHLDQIMAADKKASGIVSNLLSFSRETNFDFAVEDISLLLDQSFELTANEYGPEQNFNFSAIQVMKDYEPDLPKVKCRGGELKQVFYNILSNGAYAMAHNTDNPCPTFFMRTYAEAGQVCVEIRDNGPGMPENICKLIFEPFFSTKPHKESAGLGLSVSNFIVTENHNGTIEVESTPGEGSCFKIMLPI